MAITINLQADGNSVLLVSNVTPNGVPFKLGDLSYTIHPGNIITISGVSGGNYYSTKAENLADINGGIYANIPAFKTAFQSFFRRAGAGAGSYLGQVATRCYIPTANAGAAITWCMSESFHWSRDVIVNPVLMLANFNVTSANLEQTTGAGQVKLAIEYPVGQFTLSNENIALSNGLAPFPVGLVPYNFNIIIPRNKRFGVTILQVNPNGVVYHVCESAYTCDQTEGFEKGTGTPVDKVTTGGVIPDGKITYSPVLILSQTTQPSVLIVGDSREKGAADAITDATGDIGFAARSIGPLYGYSSIAIGASLLATYMAATRTYRDLLPQYFSHISNEYGVNDASAGDTPATLSGRRTAFAALYPTKPVIGHTLPPYTTSSDQYATTTNQASQGTIGTRILVFNDLVRAGIPGEAAYWDVADGIDKYRNGVYPVDRNPNNTTMRNIASVVGSISNVTLTVTAVNSGVLKVGDTIAGTGIVPATIITAFGTGTGGIGTYTVSKRHSAYPYGGVVASTTIVTAGFATKDGLHPNSTACEIIRDSKVIDPKLLRI